MILNLIIESDRNRPDGIAGSLGYVSGLLHLADDEISSEQGLVRIDGRVVPCGLIDHTDEHGALLDGQIRREFSKESL